MIINATGFMFIWFYCGYIGYRIFLKNINKKSFNSLDCMGKFIAIIIIIAGVCGAIGSYIAYKVDDC